MSEPTHEKDEYELRLAELGQILQACQSEKGLKSCFKCEAMLECQTRKDYVDGAYNSMAKGAMDGGFEF